MTDTNLDTPAESLDAVAISSNDNGHFEDDTEPALPARLLTHENKKIAEMASQVHSRIDIEW